MEGADHSYRWKGPFIFFSFFWLCCVACWILVPWPGIELLPAESRAQSLNHWTAREGSSAQFSSVMSNSLQLHGLQHARLPCPSPTPGACSNSCPSSKWCHPTISSSAVPFSSCPQSFPASGSFPMSQFFTTRGQRIGISVATSVLPMNIQHWFPLGWTGWISWQSKGLSRVFSNSTVQKHQHLSLCPDHNYHQYYVW